MNDAVIIGAGHNGLVAACYLARAGLIGTFADAHDPSLRQNRCFLYHVIGRGTGDWDVPIGGMGAFTGALARRARELGVRIDTRAPVRAVRPGLVETDDERIETRWILANCAPAVLDRLRGRPPAPVDRADGGAQIKVNMVVRRLPRLVDRGVDPTEAFSGTLHVNECYRQLADAHARASRGRRRLRHPRAQRGAARARSHPDVKPPGEAVA